MGLFGKMKAMKNAVTGGAAKVEVEVEAEAEINDGFDIWVTAVPSTDLNITGVYLLIRATEEAEFSDNRENFTQTVRTFEQRFDISGAESLKAGQTYKWEAEITLPEECNASFDGEMISHTWQVQAGLDAPGNDPDSGWLVFEVE